jgi:hypothetical protein
MHFIESTERFIDSVIGTINNNKFDPLDSLFMIGFFCSMDSEFVRYFAENRVRISEFSGKHLHIFSPLVYEGEIVDDDIWDGIRREFKEMGIPLTDDPAFIFFRLEENTVGDLEPSFIAGFECRSFDGFDKKLRNTIYTFRHAANKDSAALERELKRIFLSKDLISSTKAGGEFLDVVKKRLPTSKIFISHSSDDTEFAMRLAGELSNDPDMHFWIAEKEIAIGDSINGSITEALKESDYLLLVVSENSARSQWVNFKIARFMSVENEGRVLPVIAKKTNGFAEPIQNLLNNTKHLDFTATERWHENIEELRRFFRSKLEK